MLYDDQPLDLNPALVDGRRGPLSLPLSLSQEARSPTAPAPCGRKMLQRTVICGTRTQTHVHDTSLEFDDLP